MATADPTLLTTPVAGGLSPLMAAVYWGQTAVARWLLTQPIGPLTIWETAAVGNVQQMQALVEDNPRLVNVHAPDGFTPLGLAAFFGHVSALTYLLEHGADPNIPAQNQMQVRPIHSAAANRHPDIALACVRHLLAHGAEANVAQRGGWTPLHQAADHGHLALVELLLDAGADARARSEDGRLPIDMARDKGFETVVARLQQA